MSWLCRHGFHGWRTYSAEGTRTMSGVGFVAESVFVRRDACRRRGCDARREDRYAVPRWWKPVRIYRGHVPAVANAEQP